MEAQSLMHHLTEFQAKAKPSMPVFTDPARVRIMVPGFFVRVLDMLCFMCAETGGC
jgi:hypothetical protein